MLRLEDIRLMNHIAGKRKLPAEKKKKFTERMGY
jgi:hypothetical protein